MLEVGEDVAAGSQVFSDARDHPTAFLSRVIRLAKSVVDKWRGDDIGRSAFFGLRHAQRGSMRLQQFPRRVGEPRIVTEFKCCGQRARQEGEKILKQRSIRFQIRRQLKEHRAKLAGGRQWFDRRQEARNEIFRPFQPLDVRDHLVRFDAETKVRRGFLNPVLDRGLFHQLPESEIHFDRIELRSVVTEKFFLRELSGIEVRLPSSDKPIPKSRQTVEPWQDSRSKMWRKIGKRTDGIIPCVPSCASAAVSRSFLKVRL